MHFGRKRTAIDYDYCRKISFVLNNDSFSVKTVMYLFGISFIVMSPKKSSKRGRYIAFIE